MMVEKTRRATGSGAVAELLRRSPTDRMVSADQTAIASKRREEMYQSITDNCARLRKLE